MFSAITDNTDNLVRVGSRDYIIHWFCIKQSLGFSPRLVPVSALLARCYIYLSGKWTINCHNQVSETEKNVNVNIRSQSMLFLIKL
jgi:hypothetical protein